MDGVIDRLEWYEEILREDAASYVFAELAELLYEDGRFDETIEVCKRGLIFHPYHTRGKIYLALALVARGRREEARELLKDLEKEFRSYAKLFKVMSGIYKDEGETREAGRLATIARLLDSYHEGYAPTPVPKEEKPSVIEEAIPKQEPVDSFKGRIRRIFEIVDEKINMGVHETIDPFRLITEEDKEIIIAYLDHVSKTTLH